MQNLFFIYIGGTIEGALIELHDIRIVIGQTIEDTYDTLRKTWWGNPTSLHLDAWGSLHYADGHSIEVVESAPADSQLKLFFVNLGGYDSKQFTELHKNIFVVAGNEQEAKSRALQQVTTWELPHKDFLFDVDQLLNVSNMLNNKIKLTPCEKEGPFEFVCDYVKVGSQ